MKERRRKEAITIGTDPEFALVKLNGDTIGADGFNFFRSRSSTSRIGCDGAGYPVEIRPDPVKLTETDVMINQIQQIFVRIGKWCKNKSLTIHGGAIFKRSGGNSLPIGSHIHFGGSEFQLNNKICRSGTKADRMTIEDNIKKMVACLDVYFTPIANFFVGNNELYERKKTGYGTLGEVRNQLWGIEYRTPYCFLMSPLLTCGLYSLASLIAYNYKKISPDRNIYKEANYYYDVLNSNKESRKIQRNIYKKTKPRLLRAMSYNSPNKKLNASIISLFSLIEQNKTCKNRDVLSNYNLKDVKYAPFTMFWDYRSNTNNLRNKVEKQITNTRRGDIYIYERGNEYGGDHNTKRIFLSKGLPKIKYAGVSTEYINNDEKTYKYHIGFTRDMIAYILRANNKKILIDYLNNLELR